MTFTQLVWKMAKVNKKKYIFYFLCNSITVMVFFMFSTIYYNDKIVEHPQIQYGMNEILMIPAVALLIFTVFFISYAHSIFIKRRNKEFGLFMTLGMANRDLTKLILIENFGIALFSIVTGLLTGIVFSRLFFLILMSNVGIKDIPFQLNGKMFLYTIGLFLIVFIVAIGKSLFMIKTSELVKMLKSDRLSDRECFKNSILGILGIGIIFISMAVLYIFTYEEKFNLDQTIFKPIYEVSDGTLFMICTVSLFIGLYLTVSKFGSFLLIYTKKYPNIYYRRILSLTSINYKFKQLKSVLLLTIIMAMVTIFYSTFTLNFYSSAEKIADELPYDIAFVQTATKNNFSSDEVTEIFDNYNQKILKYHLIETFDYFDFHPEWNFMYRYTFMPVDTFNKVSKTKLHIDDGNYIYLISSTNSEENIDYTEGIYLNSREGNISLALQSIVREPIFDYRLRYYNPDIILVNRADYEKLRDTLDVYTAKVHWLDINDWKKSSDVVYELEKRLHARNQITPKIEDYPIGQLSPYTETELFEPVSKIDVYNMSRVDGGIIFFVSTFLSILFFFATFILLYLNVFTDIEQEKLKYRKLYKIGVTKREVKKVVTKELRILFFLAPAIGIMLSAVYIISIVQDSGGIFTNPILIVNFLTIGGLYLLFQTIYYIFATRKFINEVIN